MREIWHKNISDSLELVYQNEGPNLVTIVSGNHSDQEFWRHHFNNTSRDVFRRTGNVCVVSVSEGVPKGNFLGTFNAWSETLKLSVTKGSLMPTVALMSMVFGSGKRLSPFTQALGNRKAAFVTPFRGGTTDRFLCTADVSNIYSNPWVQHLRASGFRGVVVKWGDEALISGIAWKPGDHDFNDVDAVRFVCEMEPTEITAREKEWIIVNRRTGLVEVELARQDLASLEMRLSKFRQPSYKVCVNLGSLAVSHDFLEIGSAVFKADISDSKRSVDWDPYAWIGLLCKNESEWHAERELDDRIGKSRITALETKFPDFYPKILQLQRGLQSAVGRPLRVGALDFGQVFWADMGLHIALRRILESLTVESEVGLTMRDLFRISSRRDQRGNVLLRSVVPETAEIRDSLVMDSVITDARTKIQQGVVIGGRHKMVHMPDGGSSLFSAVDRLIFNGRHGVAFRSLGSEVTIPEGGRHTTLLLPHGPENMVSNESVVDYSDDNYDKPILGNRLSFFEAGKAMSGVEGLKLEALWSTHLR